MKTEIFTQFTATAHQLEQQYRLRYRFCIEHLGWQGRTCVDGMEYDEYDAPSTIYIVCFDDENIARGMMRIAPCSQPYMLKDHWPELVHNEALPNDDTKWEITRFCIEKNIGAAKFSHIFKQLMLSSEKIAKIKNIEEYWWVASKDNLTRIIRHNHIFAGPGMQIGDEFCYAGKSYAHNMLAPKHRDFATNQDNKIYNNIEFKASEEAA